MRVGGGGFFGREDESKGMDFLNFWGVRDSET